MLDLLHKKCKVGGYVCGQMPTNANVFCEGSLSVRSLKSAFNWMSISNKFHILKIAMYSIHLKRRVMVSTFPHLAKGIFDTSR